MSAPVYQESACRSSVRSATSFTRATADRSFIQFYLKRGTLIGADAVNRPAGFMIAPRLVEARATIPPGMLSDEAGALRTLL